MKDNTKEKLAELNRIASRDHMNIHNDIDDVQCGPSAEEYTKTKRGKFMMAIIIAVPVLLVTACVVAIVMK